MTFRFMLMCREHRSFGETGVIILRLGVFTEARYALAGANGVSVGSSLARLRHRWWKVRSLLCGKISSGDGTA